MKYTAADRRTAILICQTAALTHDLHDAYSTVASGLGLWKYSPALELALDAWKVVDRLGCHDNGGPVDGEAECLLREGWSPGEPIVRLR